MKKRNLVIFLIVIGLIFSVYLMKKRETFSWNYDGTAVVLSNRDPYEFICTTDLLLNGEIYDFGTHFLGDLRLGIFEEMRRFKGNSQSRYYDSLGVRTPYGHRLALEGEKYFEDAENRKMYEITAEPAWMDSSGQAAPGISMYNMLWYEWYEYANQEGEIKRGERQIGWICFKKAGGDFVVQTVDYVIVPGVSTREEALAFLRENFNELSRYGY